MSGRVSALFGGGLLHWSGRNRFEVFLKGVVVRLKLARLVDELLALRSIISSLHRSAGSQFGRSSLMG